MRRDMRAGQQSRPYRIGRAAGDHRHRRMPQRGHRGGTARGVFGHDRPVAPEMERAPRRIIAQRVVGRGPFGAGAHIGGKTFAVRAVGAGHRVQFGLHLRHQVHHRAQPGKLIGIVKPPLRQPRIIEQRRFLQIDLAPPGQQVDRLADGGRWRCAGRRLKMRHPRRLRRRDRGAGMRHQRAQLGRRAAIGGILVQRGGVKA